MERIASISQYKELVSRCRKRYRSVQTNSFVMPGYFTPYLERQGLYVQEYEQGIAVLTDEGRYYNCCYFWNADEPLANLRQDKPVLIEELSNNGSRDGYLQVFEPKLLRAGFRPLKTSVQVENPVLEHRQALETELERRMAGFDEQNLKLACCRDSDLISPVIALWENSLDMTDVPMDHRSLKPGDKLLCVVTRSGEVAAVNWWRNSKRSSEGRHTVTAPAYYRRGLATILLLHWCLDACGQDIPRAFTWIRTTNAPSLALYRQIGFTPNGRLSRQYLID